MKTYKLVITSIAYQRIIEIRDYITTAFSAPETAGKTIRELSNTFESLKFLPNRHKVINEKLDCEYSIRKVRCKNYFVYYYIDDDKHHVCILDVIYVKANQDNALHVIVKSV